ncbi:polysaccharide pyruvyl transferase family protein [Saliphagus infecundisoli]|uniref:Polysaccharide pyruvyl transferase family protein n=1 Tax=Saliphagus infecundisoli TaxID=1849069 RepID=A0ABD5QFJ6_9EURY|nr:polysaccharide pyruvyl transferase family protein [Saliphagus infecundisoli]
MYSLEQIRKGLRYPAMAEREMHYQWQRVRSVLPHDIGIQGSYRTGNIGDRALGRTFSGKLSAMGYRPRTFGRNTEYSRAPVHILGGGGVLHDWYGTDHLRQRLNFVSEGGAVIGVGVPGFKTTEGRELVRSGLSDVELVTVRDKWSRDRLAPHYDGDIHVTACPTLIRHDPDVPSSGRTGVNFRQWFHLDPEIMSYYFDYDGVTNFNRAQDRYLANITRICEELDDPVFIPFHEKDETFAHEHLDIEVLPYEFSVRKTLERVSSVDRMVATRYHSLVFATICETPALAIAYEPKVSSLADRVGVQSYKPHTSIPVEFDSIANRDDVRRTAERNFRLLDDICLSE